MCNFRSHVITPILPVGEQRWEGGLRPDEGRAPFPSGRSAWGERFWLRGAPAWALGPTLQQSQIIKNNRGI